VPLRVLAVVLFLGAWLGTASMALAAPLVSLEAAPDGTLVLVGSGWRADQHVIVTVGSASFPARTDSVGDFEVPTGLVPNGGAQVLLAVHRPTAPRVIAATARSTQADVPHPLAVLFAQSLMTGAACLALSAAGVGLTWLGVRLTMSLSPRKP